MAELNAMKESFPKPNFVFDSNRPAEDLRGVDLNNWPWAIVERLDYIAQALYVLVKEADETTESQP